MTKMINGKKRTYSHETTKSIVLIAIILSLLLVGVVSAADPGPVTNLTNTSYDCHGAVWTWDNPGGDFNETMIYRGGTWLKNSTAETESWSGLTESTTYTISIKACDGDGVCNATWSNNTVVTDACPNPVTCTSTGIVGALTMIGIMLIGAGAVMIIIPFSTLGGGMGRGGKTIGGMTGFTMGGIIAICIGAVLLLISYAVLSPIFTLAGC